MKAFGTLSVLAVALVAVAGTPSEAGEAMTPVPVMLKGSVKVTDAVVRLGDLFTGAGELADTAVAYAPHPGKRATFQSRWLYRVAVHYGLDWRPTVRDREVVVARDSLVITRSQIEDRIQAALAEKGVDADMSVELSNRLMRLHVPATATPTVAVEDLLYEPRMRRFVAVIVAPAGDPAAQRHRVTGRVQRMSEVPVLTRRMRHGEVIGETDVEWIRVRSERLQRNTVVDVGDLIGKTPRRVLRPGVVVRVSDVQRPVLVARRTLVIMVYEQAGMMLTAQGRALDDGGRGDTVRITNTRSNTIVEARVTGPGKVSVRPQGFAVLD